jgi:hypothetical protein
MNGPPGAECVTKYRLKPMPHYAVASLLRVNGDGSRAVSERSLDSSENKACVLSHHRAAGKPFNVIHMRITPAVSRRQLQVGNFGKKDLNFFLLRMIFVKFINFCESDGLSGRTTWACEFRRWQYDGASC